MATARAWQRMLSGRRLAGAERTTVVGIAGTVLLAAWLAGLSLFHLDQNDFMYVGSAVAEGRLYVDVHYLQAPLGFHFNRAIARIMPESVLYAALRALSVLFVAGSAGLIAFVLLRTAGARAAFLVICATSPQIVSAAIEIGTYALPLACLAGATVLLAAPSSPSVRRLTMAGLLVGLAASTKINHVLLGGALLVWAAMTGAGMRGGVAALGGMTVGALPLILQALALPELFWLHNVEYHSGITRAWRADNGVDPLAQTSAALSDLARALAGVCLGAAFLGAGPRGRMPRETLVLMLAAATLALALSALVVFRQHLATAAMLFALWAAIRLDRRIVDGPLTPTTRSTAAALAFAALLVLPTQATLHVLRSSIERSPEAPGFLGARAATERLGALSARLEPGREGCTAELFTFAAALVPGSGFVLAEHTEAGIFWRRSDRQTPPDLLERAGGPLPDGLVDPAAYVARNGIDFLLLGFYAPPYRDYEADLRAYASAQGFATHPIGRVEGREMTLAHDPRCLRAGGGSERDG